VNTPLLVTIGNNAFEYCSNLKSINLQNTTYIGQRAFQFCCYSLTSVTAPNLVSIDNYAFFDCTALYSFNAPNCTSIGLSAFAYCSSLSYVSLPKFSSQSNLRSIFYSCSNLNNVTLGIQIINTSNYLFNNSYPYLSILNLPACTQINGLRNFYGAFYNLRSYLQQLSLPLCSYIGIGGLSSLSYIKTLSLPKCEYLANTALYGMSRLSSLYLLNSSVVTFETNAFYNCSVSRIYVPSSLYTQYKTTYPSLSTRFTSYY